VTEKPVKKVELTEEELETLKTEAANAKAETEKLKQQLRAASAREAKKEKKQAASKTSQPPAPVDRAEHTADHGHEETKPHYVGAWQQFCPTCGEKNPDFKDEVVCDDCGAHLGAREIAEKMKACPNCGGHKASVIKK